jgi:TetR/AcrR family transcriptional repressor of nem operon
MDGPGRKELTHERIVETAARVIRRAGFQGVGVADIMKEAGLTHGGFYAHFASRDALLTEALARATEDSAARLKQRATARKEHARGVSAYRALVEAYLSESHLTAPEGGCPVAALLSEIPRQADEVRKAGAGCVSGLFSVVKESLPGGSAKDEVFVVTSQLVGALQLARALGDNARGKAVLSAARRALLARHAQQDAEGD